MSGTTRAAEQRAEAIEPIDRHIGRRILAGRQMRGYSRNGLAERIGMSMQMVQKWEEGINRVYASRLWAVSLALDLPYQWFVDDFQVTPGRRDPNEDLALLSRENLEVLGQYSRLSEPQQRIVRLLLAELETAADAQRTQTEADGEAV